MAMVPSIASLSLRNGQEFGHLASCSSSCNSFFPSRRPAAVWLPLRIEAREPTKKESAKVRERRKRKKCNGTSERPRLAVFRSKQHLYAQVIDDTKNETVAACSTVSKEIREDIINSAGPTMTVQDAAKKVGEFIGKACLEKGISKVSFDKGSFVYHGRIKALADAAREAGLEF